MAGLRFVRQIVVYTANNAPITTHCHCEERSDVAISWYKLEKIDAPKEKYEPKWHHRHPVVLFVTSYREIATALKGLAMTR